MFLQFFCLFCAWMLVLHPSVYENQTALLWCMKSAISETRLALIGASVLRWFNMYT